jgi:hypothetical protein
MAEYVAPQIPEVPVPAPLSAEANDVEWTRWSEQISLLINRERLLSDGYERWHVQQHRERWATLTAASTAAQELRARAESELARAGNAAADAQRQAAQAIALPLPPRDRAAFVQSAALDLLAHNPGITAAQAVAQAQALWQALTPPPVVFFPT